MPPKVTAKSKQRPPMVKRTNERPQITHREIVCDNGSQLFAFQSGYCWIHPNARAPFKHRILKCKTVTQYFHAERARRAGNNDLVALILQEASPRIAAEIAEEIDDPGADPTEDPLAYEIMKDG